MKIKIPTENGYIGDRYSRHAQPDEMYAGQPVISFPMTFTDLPAGTKTVAWKLLDDDAIPVSGFTYIHWIGANLSAEHAELKEDASRREGEAFVQGNNSTAGGLIHQTDPAITRHYVGPTPPNGDHVYTVTGYALDTTLPLQNGYWLNEFYRAIKGHVLETTKTTFLGRS
ncbi:YbhB/YbcL family Raf kinase inhibitor-like protein [Furfurilactobacillus cerevisiae]|uniref:YbhB/YbcL family Raf kinase inhibitor-like protein n=1 Tax=Furfurilactobacillus rossiae TaxID=231049 RepID=UPI003B97F8B5